jgi:hypothetical protein
MDVVTMILLALLLFVIISPYFSLWNLGDLSKIVSAINECAKALRDIARELEYLRKELRKKGADNEQIL